MSKTQTNIPIEISEDIKEDLKSVIEESSCIIREGFKKLSDEIDDFDKRFEEKRKRITNGKRGKTTGRIV